MKTIAGMAMPVMKAMAALLLTGCVEESTVIKVKPDGSGIIHERTYSAPTDKLITIPGLNPKDEDEKEATEKKPKLPEEAALREYAATLGKGVTFQSLKASTNKKGWTGYEIIYEFEDINTVRYTRKTPRPPSEDDQEDSKDRPEKKDNFTATFAMTNGELTIKMEREGFGEERKNPERARGPASPTIDPFADAEGPAPIPAELASPFANEAMLKAMTKGMRMGLFIEVDGEITKTNAVHREGRLITLFRADFGKMFESEGAMDTMKRMDMVDRKEFQQLADKLEGFDIDLQEPIRVQME